jgi:hypothetical protein
VADLQGFSISTLAAQNGIPRFQVKAVLTDPQTGAIRADFTGSSAINFPDVLATLTAPQRLELVQLIANWLLHTRAGL